MRDAAGWARFCFGGRRGAAYEAEAAGDEAARVPLVRLVLQFDSPMTQSVLAHHVRWAECAAVLKADHAAWLYALLARLDLPLHRDVQALIRRLVRRLLELRRTGDELPAVQTLLVVAGRYHRQATRGELDGTEDCEALDGLFGLSSASPPPLTTTNEEDDDEEATFGGDDDDDDDGQEDDDAYLL